MKLLLRWALNAVALMLVPEVLTEIRVDGYAAALISALLLGFVNAIIRPVLVLVTLPITLLQGPEIAQPGAAGGQARENKEDPRLGTERRDGGPGAHDPYHQP